MIPALLMLSGLLAGDADPAASAPAPAAAPTAPAPTAAEVAEARRALVQAVPKRDDLREKVELCRTTIVLHPGLIKKDETDLPKLRANVEKLGAELAKASQEIQDVEARPARHEKEQDKRNADLLKAQQKREGILAKKRTAEGDVTELSRRIDRRKDELAQAKTDLLDSEKQLKAAREAVRALAAKLPQDDPAAVAALKDDRDPAPPPELPKPPVKPVPKPAPKPEPKGDAKK